MSDSRVFRNDVKGQCGCRRQPYSINPPRRERAYTAGYRSGGSESAGRPHCWASARYSARQDRIQPPRWPRTGSAKASRPSFTARAARNNGFLARAPPCASLQPFLHDEDRAGLLVVTHLSKHRRKLLVRLRPEVFFPPLGHLARQPTKPARRIDWSTDEVSGATRRPLYRVVSCWRKRSRSRRWSPKRSEGPIEIAGDQHHLRRCLQGAGSDRMLRIA
jgi:hypothetical protein